MQHGKIAGIGQCLCRQVVGTGGDQQALEWLLERHGGKLPAEFDAVHAGHLPVNQQHVEGLAGGLGCRYLL